MKDPDNNWDYGADYLFMLCLYLVGFAFFMKWIVGVFVS